MSLVHSHAVARRAIVTDGLWRKSLSAIRSLGKAGFKVSVMGDSWLTVGFWSHFTARRVRSATAANDAEDFGRALLEELERVPGAVILPMEDASLHWVSRHEAEVSRMGHVLLPLPEALRVASDKAATIELAGRLGLPAPRTWEPASPQELVKVVSALETGGFVVKPRSGTGSSGISYGEKKTSEQWQSHWERFGRLLVQERVPAEGRGMGVSVLMDREGRCVASFAHERLQQYPNSGGPSTDRQSVHAPELEEMSLALLKKLEWRGIAMVEWKVDHRDGKPKLMEINPRFWGSLELAVRAGVDFPSLYAKAALGEKLGARPAYPPRIRCRWLVPGDLLRYLTQERSKRESWREFLKGLPTSTEEWDIRDLGGALSTVICTAALALNPRYWKYVKRG